MHLQVVLVAAVALFQTEARHAEPDGVSGGGDDGPLTVSVGGVAFGVGGAGNGTADGAKRATTG